MTAIRILSVRMKVYDADRQLNCYAHLPAAHLMWLTHLRCTDWNVPSSKEALLEKYADFDEKFKKLIRCADEVKLWQMRALPWHIETWIRGRTCIAGDAAQ